MERMETNNQGRATGIERVVPRGQSQVDNANVEHRIAFCNHADIAILGLGDEEMNEEEIEEMRTWLEHELEAKWDEIWGEIRKLDLRLETLEDKLADDLVASSGPLVD